MEWSLYIQGCVAQSPKHPRQNQHIRQVFGPFFQKDKNSISAKKAYPPAFFHNKHLNIDLVWASNELKLTKVTGSGFENSFYQLEPSPIEKQLFKNLLV